ncbi:hypothetical protein EGW08_008866, partial [Elysia chlorotica]
MTIWSCLLYTLANVVAVFLHWLYQREKAQLEQNGTSEGDRDHSSSTNSNGSIRYFNDNNNASKKKKRFFATATSVASFLGVSSNKNNNFFAFEDHFFNFEDVAKACRRAGLETCGLIVGVDFSASNEWQGRKTFSGQNLHAVATKGKVMNPYQKVISIIGRTLESFDEDNLIPAFGFGDAISKGRSVFSFKDRTAAEKMAGFSEVLHQYEEIAQTVDLGGPTDFAPIIHTAVDIVQRLKKYHILIVIADGQVVEQLSTAQAIVEASHHPLSIVMVGVGDGPWDTMEQFDDLLPERHFDNFQFVNFHALVEKNSKQTEANFALHAMMEIPYQYKTIKALGYLD